MFFLLEALIFQRHRMFNKNPYFDPYRKSKMEHHTNINALIYKTNYVIKIIVIY